MGDPYDLRNHQIGGQKVGLLRNNDSYRMMTGGTPILRNTHIWRFWLAVVGFYWRPAEPTAEAAEAKTKEEAAEANAGDVFY